jgi:hypothetical protein
MHRLFSCNSSYELQDSEPDPGQKFKILIRQKAPGPIGSGSATQVAGILYFSYPHLLTHKPQQIRKYFSFLHFKISDYISIQSLYMIISTTDKSGFSLLTFNTA